MPQIDHSPTYTKKRILMASEKCFAPIEAIFNPHNCKTETQIAQKESLILNLQKTLIPNLETKIEELNALLKQLCIEHELTLGEQKEIPHSLNSLTKTIKSKETELKKTEAQLHAYNILNALSFSDPKQNPWSKLEALYKLATTEISKRLAYKDQEQIITNDDCKLDISSLMQTYTDLGLALKKQAQLYASQPHPDPLTNFVGHSSVIRLSKRIRITNKIIRLIEKKLLHPFFGYVLTPQDSTTPSEHSTNLPNQVISPPDSSRAHPYESASEPVANTQDEAIGASLSSNAQEKPREIPTLSYNRNNTPLAAPKPPYRRAEQIIVQSRKPTFIKVDRFTSGSKNNEPLRPHYLQTPPISWYQRYKSRLAWVAAAILITAAIATAIVFAWPLVIEPNLALGLYASLTPTVAIILSLSAYGIGKGADDSRPRIAPAPIPSHSSNREINHIFADIRIEEDNKVETAPEIVSTPNAEVASPLFPEIYSLPTNEKLSPLTSDPTTSARGASTTLNTPMASGLQTPQALWSPYSTPKSSGARNPFAGTKNPFNEAQNPFADDFNNPSLNTNLR